MRRRRWRSRRRRRRRRRQRRRRRRGEREGEKAVVKKDLAKIEEEFLSTAGAELKPASGH